MLTEATRLELYNPILQHLEDEHAEYLTSLLEDFRKLETVIHQRAQQAMKMEADLLNQGFPKVEVHDLVMSKVIAPQSNRDPDEMKPLSPGAKAKLERFQEYLDMKTRPSSPIHTVSAHPSMSPPPQDNLTNYVWVNCGPIYQTTPDERQLKNQL